MDRIRLFISLPVEPVIIKEIYKKFQSLDLPWSKIKTVWPEQIHLTLKFLGDTPIDKIPDLIKALDGLPKNGEILELHIIKTLIFNQTAPKVLSLDLELNEKLSRLYQGIEETLFSHGLAHREPRQFSPHLTLARVKQSAEFKEFINFKNWPVDELYNASYFELQESVLTKQGPLYTVLQTFDL